MTDDPKSTFAKRVRAGKPRTRKYDVWDDVISGFDLRVGTSGHRSFFLRRSVHGRIRSATIGSADTMSLPEARREARKLIATFIDPARKHNGPRTPDRPMDAFAGEFLDRQARRWKPRTLESNTYMVRKYILPAFGHMTVDAIAVEHVRDWFASMTTCWRAVCEDANFGRLRLHDLRHTAASHAVMSGENLPLVGELLGHRRHRTTAGYAHLADGHLVEMAERVGRIIAGAMEGAFGTPTGRVSSKGRAIPGPPHSLTQGWTDPMGDDRSDRVHRKTLAPVATTGRRRGTCRANQAAK